MVAARLRVSGLTPPLVGGGASFAVAVFAWIELPFRWFNIAFGLWFCMCGSALVAFAVGAWRPGGRALVFTPGGILWNTGMPWNPFRSGVACIRWDDIADARFVRWKDREADEHVAVILELEIGAQNPLGAKWPKMLSKEIEKHIGITVAENVVLLHDDNWEWDAEQVADQINTSVKDVAARASWAEA
ncbi:MAG TPA: hypothetical protein VGX78_05335 [Pirellulales bacterium]|jgi:hypothetical protein|nr:hypothetical protein [Pirellulales bacterium]